MYMRYSPQEQWTNKNLSIRQNISFSKVVKFPRGSINSRDHYAGLGSLSEVGGRALLQRTRHA